MEKQEKISVVIATKNAGKIEGAKRCLERYFKEVQITGISVPSGVGEQPVGEETFQGAKNRVKNLKQLCRENGIKADLFLAIESGVFNSLGDWLVTNVAVIEDNANFFSYGTSPSFPVPANLIDKVLETDLSQVMNLVFTEDNDRHNHGGGIQLLTQGEISRIDLTDFAFVMAMTKYLNKKWN